MTLRSRVPPTLARRVLGLLAAPVPVVVVLVLTTAAQNARGRSLVATALGLAPTFAPGLYLGSLLIALLVAAPALYLVTRTRGHRAADYLAVGAATGLFTTLGYHTALTGLSLDLDESELLRLLAIGALLGAASGGLGFAVTTSGRGTAPRGATGTQR